MHWRAANYNSGNTGSLLISMCFCCACGSKQYIIVSITPISNRCYICKRGKIFFFIFMFCSEDVARNSDLELKTRELAQLEKRQITAFAKMKNRKMYISDMIYPHLYLRKFASLFCRLAPVYFFLLVYSPLI